MAEKEEVRLEGYVENVVFSNTSNGFAILEIENHEDKKNWTLTGIMPHVSEGEYLAAVGRIVVHPVYGEQLQVSSFEIKTPEDAASAERYLSSGAVKGIGPALAAKIVRRFGDDTFRILEEEPERLAEVKGISEGKAMQIASAASEKRELRRAIIFLQQFGIGLNLADKIYTRYGARIYSILRENPYELAETIDGVGFRIADGIAVKAGISADSDYRIRCAFTYVLQQAMSNGHVYLPEDILIRQTAALLEIEPEGMEQQLSELLMDRKLTARRYGDEVRVYLTRYYNMELESAGLLCDLDVPFMVELEKLEKQISAIEKDEAITLDEHQREAVLGAISHGLFILTGGPGTGKTTTITTIIRYFEKQGLEISLAAPTGRAARRMKETTGMEASTIHRLLELTGGTDDSDNMHFERNADRPLETDVVIIDEMSMVDMILMNALLKALLPGTRLILVGDVDQLPSVGPGNVLKDIIGAGCFHTVALTRIFRQEEASDIVLNAHRINSGEPVNLAARSKDFLFIRRPDADAAIRAAITLLREKLPPYVHAAQSEIQIMTPMRKGPLGAERLNIILQEQLNPPSKTKLEKVFTHATFREGDKVMQIRNDYQLTWEIRGKFGLVSEQGMGVFNGDCGVLTSMNLFTEEMTVTYDDGRIVNYNFKQADELELAYAITIHKSQGSEYPAVILPLISGPQLLMTRNLLYTAVTRAKSCVCIVGLPETFAAMEENTLQQRRYSGLKEAITELMEVRK